MVEKTYYVKRDFLGRYRLQLLKVYTITNSSHLRRIEIIPMSNWYISRKKFIKTVLNYIVGDVVWTEPEL